MNARVRKSRAAFAVIDGDLLCIYGKDVVDIDLFSSDD